MAGRPAGPRGARSTWPWGWPLPFLVLALARHGNLACVLLAAAVPMAAGAGIALRAGRAARTYSEAGEALADTLVAHTARGERARIARELHDVVAHHISMIAVQAETGRLTTPGLPEAGARRFARDRRHRAGRADRDAAAARRAPRGRGGRRPTPATPEPDRGRLRPAGSRSRGSPSSPS